MKQIDTKRILYIGGFELPDKNAAAQRVIANAKIWKSLGYSVFLVGTDKTKSKEIKIKDTKFEYENFTCYSTSYPISLTSWLIYLTSIKSIIELEEIQPSHIVAYNYPAFALFRLKQYCASKNIILLADCTEWYEATEGNFAFRFIKGLDVYFRMNVLHPKIDGLIVISQYLYNYYASKNKNVIILPPLVDLTMDKWKQNSNIDRENIEIVYAGSPGSGHKDRIDKIIKALFIIEKSIDRNIKFIVLGLTKENYLEAFGPDSFHHSMNDIVTFKGRVPHTEALKIISNADYEIFFRDNNLTNTAGFPTKFVESISCGTPVLTNLSSNIEDYLIDGKNGFMIDLSSPHAIESTLLHALKLEMNQIKEMKSYCRNSMVFDYPKFVDRFKLFLDKLHLKK